ncbi:hypothetical protein DFAR_1650002 [Desulfarculales bacterium]
MEQVLSAVADPPQCTRLSRSTILGWVRSHQGGGKLPSTLGNDRGGSRALD